MAQPHLGERTQFLFRAPSALVDVLTAYAAKSGLPMSRATSDVLVEAAGHPELVLSERPLFDFDALTAGLSRRTSSELAILKFRAPTAIVSTLDEMGAESGLKRHEVVIHLLSHAVGLQDTTSEGRQLQMTG